MKRLRIRLIEEFKDWSERFRGRSIKFKYDDLHSVILRWSIWGRYVSLQHDLSKTFIEYNQDFLDVPIPILRASIEYFKERLSKELSTKRRNSEAQE